MGERNIMFLKEGRGSGPGKRTSWSLLFLRKNCVKMSSSSDEDDDTSSKIKEALWAPGFAITAAQNQAANSEKKEPIKSLRQQTGEDSKLNKDHRGMDISITPEQQNFIAKKLDEYLEKQIKETDILSKKWADGVPVSSKSKGVKLLAGSRKRLRCEHVTEDCPTGHIVKPEIVPKHRQIEDGAPKLSDSKKLQEAAVSSEWVLKGQGVFGKLCHKGEVITDAKHADCFKKTDKSSKVK